MQGTTQMVLHRGRGGNCTLHGIVFPSHQLEWARWGFEGKQCSSQQTRAVLNRMRVSGHCKYSMSLLPLPRKH